MKFFLSCIMVLLCAGVFAQTSTLPLRADTVKIYKVGGAAELLLMNATRDSLYGLLQNIGGGKTKFIIPHMLNDSTLVIGGQTLTIKGSGGGGSGFNLYNHSDSTTDLIRRVHIMDAGEIEFHANGLNADSIVQINSGSFWSALWLKGGSSNGFTLTKDHALIQAFDVAGHGGRFDIDAFNTQAGAVYTDFNATPTGIKYAADYSATYTNRSLVDKQYVNSRIASNAVLNGGGASTITVDLFANIPPAGTAGALFVATDSLKWYLDNGGSWDAMGGSGGGDGNFAITDLTFTGDRTHELAQYSLSLNNSRQIVFRSKGATTADSTAYLLLDASPGVSPNINLTATNDGAATHLISLTGSADGTWDMYASNGANNSSLIVAYNDVSLQFFNTHGSGAFDMGDVNDTTWYWKVNDGGSIESKITLTPHNIFIKPQALNTHIAGEIINWANTSTGEIQGSQFSADTVQLHNSRADLAFLFPNASDNFATFISPGNFGTVYSGAGTSEGAYSGYSQYTGVNGDGRPDNVFSPFTYNMRPGGGLITSGEVGFRYAFEDHYQIGGLVYSEKHEEFIDLAGNPWRIRSDYMKALDGATFEQARINSTIWWDRTVPDSPYATLQDPSHAPSMILTAYGAIDISQFRMNNSTHGPAFLSWDNGTFNISTPTNKNWAIQGQDVTTNFRRWDWGSTQVGGTGLSMVFGQVPFFAGSESVVQIYGTGTTSSTQAFQIRIPTVGKSVDVYDDGTALFNMSGGSTSFGVANIGSMTASAKLEVASTTQGFLGPRGTTTQKNAISSPAEGLEFYDLTLHKLYVWDGSVWQAAW